MATFARMTSASRLRPEARVRIPQHVVHRHFPAQTVMLNLQTGRYHGLNPTAGRMLDALGEGETVAAAARIVADHYCQPRADIERDLCELCAELLARGLVELTDRRTSDGRLRVILELAAVTRTFAGRRVLGPVDLELGSGERLALPGPNGSGKSTLLRCIGGTLAPSSGTIMVDGARAGTRTARRRIGASFSQERSFYLRLTGRENLLTFACLREPGAQARRRVDELVAELGLEDIAATRMDRCSTGMVQQLAFARALLGVPGLLMLDEPTRSLDEGATERLWAALTRRPSLALIIATHRDEDIERCDRHLALKAS